MTGMDVVRATEAFVTPAAFDKEALTFTGAVHDRDGALVAASQRGPANRWFPADPPQVQIVPDAPRLERAIYLGHLFPHFGHFLIETLPALTHGGGNDWPLLLHPWIGGRPSTLKLPFFAQGLAALDIDPDRIRLVDGPLRVGEAVIPPRGAPMRGQAPAATLGVYARIAEAARRERPDGGTRKLYLSRSRYARNRRMTDEAPLEALFAARGYAVIHPETLPLLDQAALVSRAQVVAGLSGSALHLGGFMAPGAVLVHLERRPMPQVTGINAALGVITLEVKVEETLTDEAARRVARALAELGLD